MYDGSGGTASAITDAVNARDIINIWLTSSNAAFANPFCICRRYFIRASADRDALLEY